LIAPYTSLPDCDREQISPAWLVDMLWYDFPTLKYVSELQSTALFVAHGEEDEEIPVRHGKKVFEAYRGEPGDAQLVIRPATHRTIFSESADELLGFLARHASLR